MKTKSIYGLYDKEYSTGNEVTKMKVVERIIDGGFEAPIKRNMNVDEYDALLERALDGEKYAQVEYFSRFRMVVGDVSDDLLQDLRICMFLQGQEEGIVEFLDRLRIRVDVFVEEVEDLLRDHLDEGHIPMEELVEVELEDLFLGGNPEARELVFRFWAPGEGIEPIVEFTCMNPEERDDYVLSDVEFLMAAAALDDLRGIVEDTLHDLKTHGGE